MSFSGLSALLTNLFFDILLPLLQLINLLLLTNGRFLALGQQTNEFVEPITDFEMNFFRFIQLIAVQQFSRLCHLVGDQTLFGSFINFGQYLRLLGLIGLQLICDRSKLLFDFDHLHLDQLLPQTQLSFDCIILPVCNSDQTTKQNSQYEVSSTKGLK